MSGLAYPSLGLVERERSQEKVQLVDLAATATHHHIAGTSYHWKHGYIPLDRVTAARYRKKFQGQKFFHVEPEEFNGYDNYPKFVGEADPTLFTKESAPKMKYKKDKILTGHSFKYAPNKTSGKVLGVSESKTHVLIEHGDGSVGKHKISSLEPIGMQGQAALQKFQQKKYKPAIQTYKIQKAKVAPKKSTVGGAYVGQATYKPKPAAFVTHPTATAGGEFKPDANFPELTASKSLDNVNVKPALEHHEKSALQSYTGSAYMNINSQLRAGKGKTVSGYTDRMDKAFAKAQPLPGNPQLHRGTSVQALTMLQPGDEFTDPGYSSTSRDVKTAFGGSASLHIRVKTAKALDVRPISQHPSENEVLLNRGTRFVVRKRFIGPNKRVHLFVDAYES